MGSLQSFYILFLLKILSSIHFLVVWDDVVSHLKHLCVHTKTFVRFYLSCSVKYYALQKCFVVVDQNRHEFTGAFHNGSLKRTQRNTIYQQSHLDELQISQHVFNHQKREMLKFFVKLSLQMILQLLFAS